MSYRLWVSDNGGSGQFLFRLWDNGKAEVATRAASWESWGPPLPMVEETILSAPEPDPDVKYDWDRDTLALDKAQDGA